MSSELNLQKKMDFGNNFEWSFKLFKKYFLFIMKSVSYFFIPGVIVLIISFYFILPGIRDFFDNMFSAVLDESIDDKFAFSFFNSIIKLYILFFIAYFLYSLLIVAASASSIKALSVKIEQKSDSESDIAKFILKKYFPLLGTLLIAGLITTVGLCFCFIPGLILMVYMIFIPQIVILENKYFFNAIGRSFSLVKKNFWIIVLILIVFYFLYGMASSIISIPVIAVPYAKFIMKIIKMGGESDPSLAMNSMSEFMKEFLIYYLIIIGIQVIASIFYIVLMNNALTLKFYNIKNLKEGTQILNKLDKEISKNEA